MQESQQDLPGSGSRAAGAIALLIGCVPLLLAEVVPVLGIPAAVLAIWFVLKRQGQSLAVVGVVKPRKGWANTLLIGVGGAALILVLDQTVYPFLQSLIGAEAQDLSSYESIEGNNALLATYLTVSWTTAGFGEELIFRGFLMGGLARCFGRSRAAWVAAVVFSSILFGLIHHGTGIGGVLSTGITGAVLAGVYLLSRRSIWAPFLAHGLVDTIGFLLIYTGLYKSLM
jgi:membrane protease YdiL (CAAX protease family)